MSPSWTIPSFDKRGVDDLTRSLNISPTLARLLLHRGLQTPLEAGHFLNPDLSMRHDPFLFHQMEKAVNRVKGAIQNNERIMVHGDYDVDGITACAIVTHTLLQYTQKVFTYIPHRINQGYGLKQDALDVAQREKASLIITVDCGITAIQETESARQMGIDIIITDHHLYQSPLPNAVAIIHPTQPDETYPYTHLSGAGVAYKFAQAIEKTLQTSANGCLSVTDDLLDLAAMGTLSDIVLLSGENRVIAKHGLVQLAKSKRVGLRSLLEKTKLTNKCLESWHIGFILGPRINAAGRLGDADKALRLLLTDSKSEADEISETLEQYNKERQRVEAEVHDQAEKLVHSQINLNSEPIIVLANPNWHIGVLGIVCSKLVEEFERPVILIGLNGECGKGSGRSVDGFNIVEALAYCTDTLLGFGGHEMACGITIEPNQIMNFRKKINQFASGQSSPLSSDTNSLAIDTEVQLSELNESFLNSLHLLAPHGPGNPKPLFLVRNVTTEGPPRIIKDSHLKLRIRDGNYRAEAIWFGNSDKADLFTGNGKSWDLACHARLNDYNGFQNIELQLKDVRTSQR